MDMTQAQQSILLVIAGNCYQLERKSVKVRTKRSGARKDDTNNISYWSLPKGETYLDGQPKRREASFRSITKLQELGYVFIEQTNKEGSTWTTWYSGPTLKGWNWVEAQAVGFRAQITNYDNAFREEQAQLALAATTNWTVVARKKRTRVTTSNRRQRAMEQIVVADVSEEESIKQALCDKFKKKLETNPEEFYFANVHGKDWIDPNPTEEFEDETEWEFEVIPYAEGAQSIVDKQALLKAMKGRGLYDVVRWLPSGILGYIKDTVDVRTQKTRLWAIPEGERLLDWSGTQEAETAPSFENMTDLSRFSVIDFE